MTSVSSATSCGAAGLLPGLSVGRELLHGLGDVALVLQQDVHSARRRVGVDVLDAEQQQRARPVKRLGHRRRLLELELTDGANDASDLIREVLRDVGNLGEDDLLLALEIRVVDVEVQATTLQRLGEL